MLEIDIDDCKLSRKRSILKYILRNACVFESENGFHFTDYLDQLENISPTIDPSALTDEVRRYIEQDLQKNHERYSRHVKLVESFMNLGGSHCLDIGCGGGRFLSELKTRGAEVHGIEPNDGRAHYAQTTYGLILSKLPVDHNYWQNGYRNTFDLITLWDVIEHVNLPFLTLRASRNLLRVGGFLMLDTPCKDSYYYRLGELSQKITKGYWPGFLDILYKDEPFGHKQIFSTTEMKVMLALSGFKCVSMIRIHELSFPMAYYFRRLRYPDLIARFLGVTVGWIVRLFHVRNKMVIVAQRT